jgi:ABC-type amino acid transport substrate-binding protein
MVSQDLSALGGLLDQTRVGGSSADGKDLTNLRIGHDTAYPPWTHIENGIPCGLSVDHVSGLLASIGRKPVFNGGQWQNLYEKFIDGDIDVLINVGWPNAFFEKEPVVASLPYSRFKIRLFSTQEEIINAADIRGRRVAAQRGSFAEEIVNGAGFECVLFENDIQGMVHLLWNNVEAVATEEQVGAFISKSLFMDRIHAVSDALATLDVVYLFRENSRDLKDLFDSEIRKMT